VTVAIVRNGSLHTVVIGQTGGGLLTTKSLMGKAVVVAFNREVVSGSP